MTANRPPGLMIKVMSRDAWVKAVIGVAESLQLIGRLPCLLEQKLGNLSMRQ